MKEKIRNGFPGQAEKIAGASRLALFEGLIAIITTTYSSSLFFIFMFFAIRWKRLWVPLAVFFIFTINIPFQIMKLLYWQTIIGDDNLNTIMFLAQLIMLILDAIITGIVLFNLSYYRRR